MLYQAWILVPCRHKPSPIQTEHHWFTSKSGKYERNKHPKLTFSKRNEYLNSGIPLSKVSTALCELWTEMESWSSGLTARRRESMVVQKSTPTLEICVLVLCNMKIVTYPWFSHLSVLKRKNKVHFALAHHIHFARWHHWHIRMHIMEWCRLKKFCDAS